MEWSEGERENAYVGFQHVHIVIGTQQSNLLGSPPGESDFVDRIESLQFVVDGGCE